MPLSALALVLTAALLHAVWNIAAKKAGGNHHFALICVLITCALWANLGFEKTSGSLLDASWPEYDAEALKRDTIELVLQVNGKTRGAISVAANADKATIEALAAAAPEVAKFGEGRSPKKIIVA